MTEGRRPQGCEVIAGFRKISAWEEERHKSTPSLREGAQAVKEDQHPLAFFLCTAQCSWLSLEQFGCSAAKPQVIWGRMQCNEDMAVARLAVKLRDVCSHSRYAQAPGELACWFAKLLLQQLPTSRRSGPHYSAHFSKTPAWDWMIGVLLSGRCGVHTCQVLEDGEVGTQCCKGGSPVLLRRKPWGNCGCV